jgi:hypothetical protein
MVAVMTEIEVNTPERTQAGTLPAGGYFEELHVVRNRIDEKKRIGTHGTRAQEIDHQSWQFSDENADGVEICCGWSEPEYDLSDDSGESSYSWEDSAEFSNSSWNEAVKSSISGERETRRPEASASRDFLLETIKQSTEKTEVQRATKRKSPANKKRSIQVLNIWTISRDMVLSGGCVERNLIGNKKRTNK